MTAQDLFRSALIVCAVSGSAATAIAQSRPWDRLEDKGASFAGTINDSKQSIAFICSADGKASMAISSPTFRVSVPDDHRYSLVVATDRERLELVVTAKDADLLYEPKDLNARIMLDRLVEDIAGSRKFTAAVSNLGWQVEFSGEGAADALKNIFAHC